MFGQLVLMWFLIQESDCYLCMVSCNLNGIQSTVKINCMLKSFVEQGLRTGQAGEVLLGKELAWERKKER